MVVSTGRSFHRAARKDRMSKYVNPNHPVGELYPQESGFMKGTLNVTKQPGGGRGALSTKAYQSWVADQVAESKKQTAPVKKSAA